MKSTKIITLNAMSFAIILCPGSLISDRLVKTTTAIMARMAEIAWIIVTYSILSTVAQPGVSDAAGAEHTQM